MTSGIAAIGVALLLSTSAAASPGVSEDTISSPQVMVLHGSNGYVVAVDAFSGARGRRARVVVSAYRGHHLMRYIAPASLAGEGIHASLGRFGRIDMRWVPDGRLGEINLSCHGHEPRRSYLFDRGAYVGTLRFRGGHGFTAVRAHRVEWQPAWYRGYDTCRREGGESNSGSERLLQVQAGTRHSGLRRFFAYQPKAGARVEFEAYDREAVGHVEVKRSTWTDGAPKSFTSSPDFAAATIAPPAPFTGTATFVHNEGDHGTWLGDLTVDFPDGTEMPMAGSAFTATLSGGSFAQTASNQDN